MACVCVLLSCECLAKHVGLHILCRQAPCSLTIGPLRVEQRTQRKTVYNTVMRTAIVAGSGACAALAGHRAAHAALGPGESALYAGDALQAPVLGLSVCAAFSVVFWLLSNACSGLPFVLA